MRVGFLFNHDQTHQVAHSAPVAVALARLRPDWTIVLASGSEALAAEVERIVGPDAPANLVRERLDHRSAVSRLAARALDGWLPAAKLTIYRDNLPFFAGLDALVVAEKTSAILRTRYGLTDLALIHTRHGAGDRAIGFDPASALFDHVLVSGPKIRDRLVAEAGMPPERLSIVGYPKFDTLPPDPPPLRVGRPTVLYNPHPSPALSSWFRDGPAVLDWFADHPDYNLIFAPHVMLFQRPVTLSLSPPRLDRPGRIARRWRDAPNILIDTGSRAATDMTHTRSADVYLGDVSSQLYEFLWRPRPAIFLNSHGVAWEGDPNYAHWRTGQVIDSVAALGPALERAWDKQTEFRPVQEALFAASIQLTAERSSDRASRAIVAALAR